MAITISGENNNDRILAQDGVIDEISGINIVGLLTAGHINVGSNIQLGNAGIITATTFVGNVTGNVNSTSPLLLQTGGSERFRWKQDQTHTVDGFLAHEAQTVVPESVQGEKDGEQMQVMDNSKLVPVLTAALKEAIAKIENLETKVAVLESS